jgi:hypothetical protein
MQSNKQITMHSQWHDAKNHIEITIQSQKTMQSRGGAQRMHFDVGLPPPPNPPTPPATPKPNQKHESKPDENNANAGKLPPEATPKRCHNTVMQITVIIVMAITAVTVAR